MIKKFNEYIKENKKSILELTTDEIDDQFLRLKEVFNCRLMVTSNISNFPHNANGNWANIIIKQPECEVHSFIWKNADEIKEDIEQIKRRLEDIYDVTMIIRYPMEKNLNGYTNDEKNAFFKIFDFDHKYNFYQILILEN